MGKNTAYVELPSELADAHILKTTAFAFLLWVANSSLSFERKTLNPDILISYHSGTHTYADRKRNEEICSASFDGPRGILVHACSILRTFPITLLKYTWTAQNCGTYT